MTTKKKYVAVGTGGRVPMFIDPIVRDYSDTSELLGLCDLSQTRMEYHRDRLIELGLKNPLKLYLAKDFDRMLEELKPDVVIVCTMDAFHHDYIIRAVNFGADVICEKPVTTDAEKCRAITEAVERTGRKVRVTFNYRWSPGVTKVRELLQSGLIGNIKHVQLEYLLNTKHGADYFRRWHSHKENSGGLLVHKSTHHFDVVNWWVNSIPKTVFGMGDLVYYGKENAVKRGEEALTRYERYVDADPSDPFYLDLKSTPQMKGLYLDAEKDSGYIRDQNVFRKGINIEDSMSVLVRYRSGVMFNYSLNAYCPWEGFRASINGDKGRIEYEDIHAGHIISGQDDVELGKEQGGGRYKITVFPLFKDSGYNVEVETAEGDHGGGDPLIQEQIFAAHPSKDPFARNAGYQQGIASAIIGIAANQSIASGLPVDIDSIVSLPAEAKKLSDLY